MLLHKNACNFFNYGPISKLNLDLKLEIELNILILRIC